MKSWLLRYSRGNMPGVYALLAVCQILQGIAQHFTGKHYGWLPPWAQITAGSVLLASALLRLTLGRWLDKPPAPPVQVPYFGPLPPRVTPVFTEYPFGKLP